MNLKKISLGALALFSITSCNHQPKARPEMPPQEYPLQVMTPQDAELQSRYPATIRGQEDIEIRPRVDGFIEAIYIDEGAIVKKGTPLFKINSPQTEQALLTAQAAVTSAEAGVNTAKLNVVKTRPLAEKGIVSKYQLEIVENAYASAQASLAQAEAALNNARVTRSWSTVTSPVNGVVGSITYRLGSLVNSMNVLTTVSNTNQVFVFFSLNEKELLTFLEYTPGNSQQEKIKNAPPVSLVLANGTEYPEKGKIETITGVVNTQTGSVNFRATFPNPNGLLRSGSSGEISIPLIKKGVYVIAQKSTFSLQDKVLTYKVQGDSVVQRVITVLPLPSGQQYVVTGGLQTGDTIVSDGIATLVNGKKIKVQ